MVDLQQVLTFTEAAEKWGLAGGNTLRQAVARGRFHEEEVRKSGTVWLTTYEAMTRVFGPLPKEKKRPGIFQQSVIFQALLTANRSSKELERIKKEAAALFKEGKQLQINENLFGKEIPLYLLSTQAEWERWLKHTEMSLIPRTANQKE